MQLTRRGFSALALSAIAVRPGRAAEPIRFTTLAGIEYMVPMYAKELGLFEKRGVNVEMAIQPQAPLLLPAVVSGSLEIGVSTAVQVAMAHEQGLDIVVVSGIGGTTSEHPILDCVVRKGMNPQKPTDFVGKRVVTPGNNGTGYVMFVRYLMQGGVDPKSVTFVEAPFPRMGDLLRGGQVDAAVTVPPFTNRIIKAGIGDSFTFFVPTAEQGYVLTSVYIAKRSWAEANIDALRKINDALQEANDKMRADPKASAAFVVKTLKLPPDVVAAQPPPSTHPHFKLSDVQFWADVAFEEKMTKKRVDAKDIVVM